nr:immunoglobulin heavy chain junction region [Macaca mulatta]
SARDVFGGGLDYW